MAFPEIVDLQIAAGAATLQLKESERRALHKHFELFSERLGVLDPRSIEGLRIFKQTMQEVDGAEDAYYLEGLLTSFNLDRLHKILEKYGNQ